MTAPTRTLRPGLLVSLRTTIRGGVTYRRQDLGEQRDGATEVSEWQTKRTITDAVELDAATKARGKARSLIVSVCSQSDFGLLCPADNEQKLNDAIEAAQRVIADFNAAANHSTITVAVLKGRIAGDDVEAQKAINGEVRDLIETMQRGIASADVEGIREAARKARALGSILTEDASRKVTNAIEQARDAAREIVKRVQKNGEEQAKVIESLKVAEIAAARASFLDLDDAGPVTPIAPVASALDLDGAEVTP